MSRARTWKVCEPSARPVRDKGETQLVKAAPSSEHSKEATPEVASAPLNSKTAVDEAEGSGGVEVRLVVGAVASTVQLCDAGVASVLPA